MEWQPYPRWVTNKAGTRELVLDKTQEELATGKPAVLHKQEPKPELKQPEPKPEPKQAQKPEPAEKHSFKEEHSFTEEHSFKEEFSDMAEKSLTEKPAEKKHK